MIFTFIPLALYPDMFPGPLGVSMARKAEAEGLDAWGRYLREGLAR